MVGLKPNPTRFVLPVSVAELHSMHSFLIQNGISPPGANQFVNGEYVADVKDRKLLAQLMMRMARGPT